MQGNDLNKALEDAGFNAKALDRIRLTRGVVGKTSYVTAAAITALGIVGISLRDPLYLIVLAVLIAFIFMIYLGGVLWFANKHPGVALLEGAELIKWRQIEMGSKASPEQLPSGPPVSPSEFLPETEISQ